jgi:cobalt-zinc-cadmium efflux system outer membrane protein
VEEARGLREKVLPGAKSAVDQITQGYSNGRFSQLDVLEAQKGYNESRTQYVRALATYQKAQAQIDALTAGPIELPRPSGPVSKTYRKAKEEALRK